MTQQIINVGAVANDGTGESLRSAFQAVNDNFSNVWAQGPVDSQVVISNNVISTNVSNQNLVLRPDGTGVITVASSVVPGIDSVWDLGAANAQYDSVYARYYYGDASNMTGLPQPTNLGAVNTDILPIATQAFDIGSQTQQWQKVYTGGIVAGNTSVITINIGNLHIPGGTNGYVLQTDGTGNLSWTAQTGGGGNGTPGGANTQIQFNDAGTFGGQADFTFNKTSNVMTVPGNIIPNANAAQSLGNVSHQWKDLWVSNNTIYINSVPLTLSAGNVLSIGGEPLVTVNANSVANIGNFVFNGNRLENNNGSSFDNGSLVNGATALLSLPANGNTGPVAVYNSYGNIVLQAGANSDVTAQWNFNNDGTLSTQGNITANSVTLSGELIFANGLGAVGEVGYGFTGPAINAYTGKSVTIRSNDQAYSWNFGNAGNLTLPDGSVIDQGGLYGNGAGVLGNASGDIQVYAQNSGVGIQTSDGTNTHTWFYDRNGNLTLPGNTFAVNYANGTQVALGGAGVTNKISNGSSNVEIAGANSNVTVTVNDQQTWTFGTNGDLLFPRDAAGNTDPYLTITGGANPRILSEDASQEGPANLEITALNTVFTGLTGQKVTIYPDDGEIAADSNLQIWTNAGNVNEQSWTFDTTGNLTTSSNLIIGPSPAGGSSILQYDSALQVVGEGANAIMVMGWAANTNAPDSIAVVGFNTPYTNGASNVQIAVGNNATTVNYWTFDNTGNLTLPGGGIIYGNPYTPSGAPGNTITLQPAGSGTITDQRLLVYPTAGDGDHIHLTSGNLYQTELFLGSDNLYVKLSASGNIVVNANDGTGNTAQWNFGTDGTTIFPGNITGSGASPAPSISGFDSINSVTVSASGNITGNYIFGNGSQLTNLPAPTVAQDITSVGNMSLMTYDGNIKYVNYATVEPATGSINSSGNISATGNVIGNYFVGNGSALTSVATQVTGSWTLTTGTNTVSFTIPTSGTYSIWVNGNIPNGIATYTATIVLTNTNVPVLGSSYAWYYAGGNALVWTSIPNQIVGTNNAISNAAPAVSNTNVFTFGIDNNSGSSQVVNYGWTKIG